MHRTVQVDLRLLIEAELTQITAGHLLADRAVNAVSRVLNSAGALAERIRNDYGEDLLVQSHLDGEADDFRLLIQVKGVSASIRSDGTRNFRLKVSHLRRWISQSEPILVCVVDAATRQIHAFSPTERFSLWELVTTKRQTITVKLAKKDIFNIKTAKKFIWDARIVHWSRMLSWYENHYHYSDLTLAAPSSRKRIQLNGNVVTLSFLTSINIIEDDRIAKEFRRFIRNGAKSLGKKYAGEKDMDLSSVFTLGLLNQVHAVCDSGLPSNLLVHGTELCGYFFSKWHPKEWRSACKQFPVSEWIPFGSDDDKRYPDERSDIRE